MTGPAWARSAGGVIVATVVLVLIGALSQLRYDPPGSDEALIRLSWRYRAERVEECRRLTEAELESRPVHMRVPEVCDGKMEPYRLTVRLDERTVVDVVTTGAGIREDRPIFVLEDLRVAPGERHLQVDFGRESDEGIGAGRTLLNLDTAVFVSRGTVLLVTYDPDRGTLVVRGT